MKTFIKNNYKKIIVLVLLFLFFLAWNTLFIQITADEIWNYGFAHSIYKGLVPYKDFNMIITPLYPFLMSLPFHIFGSNMLILNIEQSIILTIITYLVSTKLKKKTLLFIILLVFPLPIIMPSYNTFIFLICLILIMLEEKQTNDYLIGIILALGILTKQSVGVCLVLPSLLYLKQPKKLLKRFIGCLIPMVIFLLYLIFSNSLKDFIDLCFLGLFDFSNKNGNYFNIYFVFIGILFILILLTIKKDYKNISNYYTLAFISVAIPLFDLYHSQLAFLMFGYNFLNNYNREIKINIKMFSLVVLAVLSIEWCRDSFKNCREFPSKIKHFEYRIKEYDIVKPCEEMTEYIRKNSEKEIVYISTWSYLYRLSNDMDITWLDLVNDGNWGHNGEKKMLKEIKKKKDALFIITKKELSNRYQTNKSVLKYIIKYGKKIDTIGEHDVYVFE